MVREYTTTANEDGAYDIVDVRTGEVVGSDPDEDMADFRAGEMFCDDEVMISFERDVCYVCHGTGTLRELQQKDGEVIPHYSPCPRCERLRRRKADTDYLSNYLSAFLLRNAVADPTAWEDSATVDLNNIEGVSDVTVAMAVIRAYMNGTKGVVDVSQGKCPGFDAFVDRHVVDIQK